MEGLKFKEYDVQLNPGYEIFVYTDGIPEAIDKDVQQYGVERLIDVLNANKDLAMDVLLPTVTKDLSDFVGEAEQFDDVTMLGFRFKG